MDADRAPARSVVLRELRGTVVVSVRAEATELDVNDDRGVLRARVLEVLSGAGLAPGDAIEIRKPSLWIGHGRARGRAHEKEGRDYVFALRPAPAGWEVVHTDLLGFAWGTADVLPTGAAPRSSCAARCSRSTSFGKGGRDDSARDVAVGAAPLRGRE